VFSPYLPLHTNPVAPLSLEGFGFNSNNSTKRLPGFKYTSENWRTGKTENVFGSTVEATNRAEPSGELMIVKLPDLW